MTEQTKNFLLYGIEAHIKPKEIYKLTYCATSNRLCENL